MSINQRRGKKSTDDRLKKLFSDTKIKYIFYDLDGTLVNTRIVFDNAILDAIKLLGVAPKDVKSRESLFREIIWALRPEMGIYPSIMEVSCLAVAKNLGLKPENNKTQAALSRVKEIYTTDIPPLMPKAKETVMTLDGLVSSSFLVTHAQEPWTRIKLEGVGLTGSFAEVFCFFINFHKSEQWKKLFEKINIDPKKALVIGDNFAADIAEPVSLGARGIFINAGRFNKFGKFGMEGEINQGDILATGRVAVVKEIAGVIPMLKTLDKDDWRN